MPNSISEVTRRKVMDLCILLPLVWSGRLSEPDFLARIFPLRELPSNDHRYEDAYGDIVQHRVNNPEDWGDDYIFTDPRFNLLWGTDENFLKFLEATVHPTARPGDDAAALVETYNEILILDGYELRQDGSLSGHPLYKVGTIDPWAATQKKAEPVTAWGTRQEKTEPVDPWPAPQKTAPQTVVELVADILPSPDGEQESNSPAVSIPGGLPLTSGITPSPDEKKIFIVHGHDDQAKIYVHHFLNQLTGRDAVILHEQGNLGQSLIEKLEKAAAQANFAVIILTADDLGKAKDPKAKDGKEFAPRGRQNVVFEMGYFMALLGRKNVVILQEADVIEPGDVRGMLYIPFQTDAHYWKNKLAGELHEAGIHVDLRVLTK